MTELIVFRKEHVILNTYLITLPNVNFSGNFHSEQHFVDLCTISVEISVVKSILLFWEPSYV